MTHKIRSIEELEKLINNRIHIDNLEIPNFELDISNHLKFLTNLTQLVSTHYYEYDIDLSELTNLIHLKINTIFNKVNISKLSNLKHLNLKTAQQTDFTLFTNLTYLELHNKNDTGLSNLTNLTILHLYTNTEQINFSLLSNLTNLRIGNNYDYPVDLSKLSNLEKISIPMNYRYIIDLSKCEKLKSVNFRADKNNYSIQIKDDEKIEVVDVSKLNAEYFDLCVMENIGLLIKKK